MRTRAGYGRSGKVKRLNKEALLRVEENSVAIADALMEAIKRGHVMSARLLIELAEGTIDAEEAMNTKVGYSLAFNLSKSPEWPSPALKNEAGAHAAGK